MDLDQELQAFQKKYTNLAQQSKSESLEQHVYSEVVGNINPPFCHFLVSAIANLVSRLSRHG